MARFLVRTLADLGDALTLAPERHLAAGMHGTDGVALGSLVVERNERVGPPLLASAVVLDTTHAKDGILDVRAALRASGQATSAKKRVMAGDLLISRLRPYLRQIALAHPAVVRACEGKELACSTEFYVLGPAEPGGSLAYLVPFLLGDAAQRVLAAGQEGGHHPRVPRETVLALRVPRALVRGRHAASARVGKALASLDAAGAAYARALRLK